MKWLRQSVIRKYLINYRKTSLPPLQTFRRQKWPTQRFNHRINLQRHAQARSFSLSSIPTVLLPPVVFTGLLITLWTYKCMMMVIFQNKIIYMPSMPPFSRSEKVEDYANECKPVTWREISIKSLDGTKLKLLEGSISSAPSLATTTTPTNTAHDGQAQDRPKHVIIVYLQGNASSLPPRLPFLSNILKMLHNLDTVDVRYTIVALSYRGFWQSSGSANQKGIELDARATLEWLAATKIKPALNDTFHDTRIVLWGQSIGAGVATTALATWLSEPQLQGMNDCTMRMHIAGLLLETPFTSLRAMLESLYPQRFLPYRYLWPFLRSTWDSEQALTSIGRALRKSGKYDGREESIASNGNGAQGGQSAHTDQLKVLLLEAEDDELVPKGDAARLLDVCRRHGAGAINAEHKVVQGALHTNVMMKSGGKKEIVKFLRSFARD